MAAQNAPLVGLEADLARLSTADALLCVRCAYTDPATAHECPRAGLQACSSCRLVKYCSKECQHKHWKLHSRDCKDPMRSEQWKPGWVEGGRTASFVGSEPRKHALSQRLQLWGNMPAIDILKLTPDDAKSRADISLAFIASGDLRNAIKTVNGLPEDYAGTLTILLNDREPYTTLRNILTLQLLAQTADKPHAADAALHLWYSAFLPQEHADAIAALARALAASGGIMHTQLGENASLDVDIGAAPCALAGQLFASKQYSAAAARQSLTATRFDPARVDLRHRRWMRCTPPHRLALAQHARTGVLLPFGAPRARFEAPNRTLFDPDGEWVQGDGADPLDVWDTEDVVATGAKHGCTREDLYGCLYFHVLAQLRAFAARLARFRVHIVLTDADACALAAALWGGDLAGAGLGASVRFDRVDASNLGDAHYLGVPRVLGAWGGFVRTGERPGVLVAHFVNWIAGAPGATFGKDDMEELFMRLAATGRVPQPDARTRKSPAAMKAWIAGAGSLAHVYDAVHDSAPAFDAFLARVGLPGVLARVRLRRRLLHHVVPHRLCAPVHASPNALPEFKDTESWYLQSSIGCPMWTERYIELVPV
ncbi:zf-MYND and DUF4470 domain-containing protein [Phanerochaete sordida]|uniref:Zf-MYND and DUF4470 domain-containing protein n=1 Tax=Phanerochaete sordida TaxID=48140 RepID=A0A9P3GFY7_9APHY|nr:zf-MYND and DUF4470 domain-containing protein [Phanerochaete sordida]